MALFKNGFLEYLETGEHTDLTLLVSEKSYKVHRIILAYGSEYFARLLMGEFQEKNQSVIQLKFPDQAGVFPEILRYLYSGKVTLTLDNAIPLLVMSDHFLIKNLHQMCSNYIRKNTNKGNVLEMLKKAVEYEAMDIIEYCSGVTSKSFWLLPKPCDFSFLPFHVFSKILHHKYLAVKDEFELYKCIVAYIESTAEDLQESQIEELMKSIRFCFMTFAQLEECVKNESVPKHLLLEAILARLKKHELNVPLSDPENIRLQKRVYCTTFEYESDFDDKGILHFISTNGGTDRWVNPHFSGKVTITASSIEVGNVGDLLFRVPSELWTKDVPSSWFTLDFGKTKAVTPTHYTLRHGGNYKADSLRNWDLQGSVDGKNWVVLRRHSGDTSLTDKWATHTWSLHLEKPQSFRYFRILQTGRNSSNHNFLVLSGVELYGDLYEWQEDET